MKQIRSIAAWCGILLLTLLPACTVNFSMSGASLNPSSQTVSVGYFNNMAAMVAPILSPTLTDELKRKLTSQTRLRLVNEEGDLDFTGEITNYTSDPLAISANEYAVKNRLTITVKVTFTNKQDPQYGFRDKIFSEYEDYDSNILLQSAESTLIPQIVEKLVDNIFNEALSNW